jgi:hypothetical protein
MLERLRMQEVSEVVLTVPEGAVIAGTNLTIGEPIMIIKDPSLSVLEFKTTEQANNDAKGFLSASGLTSKLDFTINEGSILYSVWSYIHGTLEQKGTSKLKGTEWITPDKIMGTDFYLSTESEPKNVTLYELVDGVLQKKTRGEDYAIYADGNRFLIRLSYQPNFNKFFAVYSYTLDDVNITKVKQIHNNVFGALDIYFKAVDIETEDEHVVCIHCDKVQIFMDLAISINNSQEVSFTPIRICSIPMGVEQGINKDIATITVI